MARLQWFSPTPEQIAEAHAVAAKLGLAAYWQGGALCVGEPDPLPAPVVPDSVSPRQARLALLSIGKLSAVEQALASIPGPQGEAARIDWEYATEVQRNSPLIDALAPALGLTSGQIDDLFRAAEGL